MKIIYDDQADAAFVFLVDEIPKGGAKRSEICDVEIENGAIILLFSPDDKLIGLEILGASRVFPEELLQNSPRSN